MDKLLELFDKYDGRPVFYGGCDIADFLDWHLKSYVHDLNDSVKKEDNPLIGAAVCDQVTSYVSEIADNSNALVEVLRSYSYEEADESSQRVSTIFEKMKPLISYRYSTAFGTEEYYRIRALKDPPFPLNRSELFHVPWGKRNLIKNERYSLAGYPCMYLSSNPELAWYESGQPDRFAVAKFHIPQEDGTFEFVDFSPKLKDLSKLIWGRCNGKTDASAARVQFLKQIYIYPLRAACSIENRSLLNDRHDEYIIPQILMQWIRQESGFDGVRYESRARSDKVSSLYYHNIALVTNKYDTDGYDEKLRKCVTVGEPKVFDRNNIECPDKILALSTEKLRDAPYLWNMTNISAEYQPI